MRFGLGFGFEIGPSHDIVFIALRHKTTTCHGIAQRPRVLPSPALNHQAPLGATGRVGALPCHCRGLWWHGHGHSWLCHGTCHCYAMKLKNNVHCCGNYTYHSTYHRIAMGLPWRCTAIKRRPGGGLGLGLRLGVGHCHGLSWLCYGTAMALPLPQKKGKQGQHPLCGLCVARTIVPLCSFAAKLNVLNFDLGFVRVSSCTTNN